MVLIHTHKVWNEERISGAIVTLTKHFIFIFSVEFYLLRNGTDSPMCGSDVTDPCETFHCLLKVFETKYHPPDSPDLVVVTDMDVTINGTTLASLTYIDHFHY